MRGKKSVFWWLFFSGVIVFFILIMQPLEVLIFSDYIAMLFPKGIIALEQRNLLFFIQIIMLLIILPVYAFTFLFSWWYRADNDKAKYDPHLVDNHFAEVVWWGLPFILTVVVAWVTWVKTHELDPYKPLESDKKAIVIEAVALEWKWLFIYPEEQIATVNYIQFPKDRPITFMITADAPMNSFWIPRLSGQIYAMTGMTTQLNLNAFEEGVYRGSSAQISGKGFAGMTFKTKASSEEEYADWIEKVKGSEQGLDWSTYQQIAKPSEYVPPQFFRLNDDQIFEQILDKYRKPKKA